MNVRTVIFESQILSGRVDGFRGTVMRATSIFGIYAVIQMVRRGRGKKLPSCRWDVVQKTQDGNVES